MSKALFLFSLLHAGRWLVYSWLGLLVNELKWDLGTFQLWGLLELWDEEEFLSPAWTNKQSLASSGNSSPHSLARIKTCLEARRIRLPICNQTKWY